MPLPDGLLAFWNLEESSGTRVDSAGNFDLTDSGATGGAAFNPQFRTGINGPGASFVGTTALTRSNSTDLHVADINFTVSAWFKLTFNGTRNVVGKFNAETEGLNWAISTTIGATPDANTIRFIYGTGSSTVSFGLNRTAPANETNVKTRALVSDQWYHVVGQHMAGVGIRACLNNGNESVVSKWGVFQTAAFAATSASRFGIGARVSSVGGQLNNMTGAVCNVGIWSRCISDSEVGDLWNGGYGLDYPFAI